jgi:hypothetical protein
MDKDEIINCLWDYYSVAEILDECGFPWLEPGTFFPFLQDDSIYLQVDDLWYESGDPEYSRTFVVVEDNSEHGWSLEEV